MADPTRATKNWPDPSRVKNFWPGPITFPFIVKKNLFGSGQKVPGSKGWLASYLLWVKKKLGSGQGHSLMSSSKSLLIFRQIFHLSPHFMLHYRADLHITCHNTNPRFSYIKGCHYIYKKFRCWFFSSLGRSLLGFCTRSFISFTLFRPLLPAQHFGFIWSLTVNLSPFAKAERSSCTSWCLVLQNADFLKHSLALGQNLVRG